MYRPVAPKIRSEIIEVFIVRAAPAERDALRVQLDKMSWDELEQAHEALQAQNHLRVQEEELARIAVEREADRIWHEEAMRLAREPQRKAEEKAQLEADHKTFIVAAKTLRSFGVTQANLNVCRSTLGGGFSIYDIQQMLEANGAVLSGPTQQELDEWTREETKAEILRLKSMDLTSLRKLVREEGARIVGQQPAPDQTQKIRQAERDAATTYEKLPPDISAEDILTASVSKLRFLKQKYGNTQLDAVLADYRQANAVIDRF